MPFTARVSNNTFHHIFSPPDLSTALVALPLLTELDAVIQTESSQDINVELGLSVQYLTASRVGLNTFRALGAGSS